MKRMNRRLPVLLAGSLALGTGTIGAGAPQPLPRLESPAPSVRAGALRLTLEDAAAGRVSLRADGWGAFFLDRLRPELRLDGARARAGRCRFEADGRSLRLSYGLSGRGLLSLVFSAAADDSLRLQSELRNTAGRPLVLNAVDLLAAPASGEAASFGADPAAVRVLEQGNYWGRVVPLASVRSSAAGGSSTEPGAAPGPKRHRSDFVSVVYDRGARQALLCGFESSERWWGKIETGTTGRGGATWKVGFDGGDLLIAPGETVVFEPVVFLTGRDPWKLLETYADGVARLHPSPPLPAPPVSWCSWYPYRLGVTEERILETARIAAARLKPLGLRVIEIDLGWQARQLPSTFEENGQFPRGLKWLSAELGKLGFDLGVWSAPYSISEFDPVAAAHPEWLVRDAGGAPFVEWEWFWPPHGKVYVLDLTHPGARDYLHAKMQSLAERGVRYLKSDFIGCVSDGRARTRHDRRIVGGGGLEAARLGARIIREALPGALLLNCGGPEMPGSGQWPLLYTCQDTGNTGFIPLSFERANLEALATHLYKNGRWGVLQPSCLCVGLPGTLEEARRRATAAFLAGGQIDISDALESLPEDRWQVLAATLPPLGTTARPIDLFDPIGGPAAFGDASSTASGTMAAAGHKDHPPGSVWHVHVTADWDEWDLVGVFSHEDTASAKTPSIGRFQIPLARLGLPADARVWGYEFWSRQCLGTLPARRTNPGGYLHPGDVQDLSVGDAPGVLDIAFFGTGAKLICLRRPRPHPWIVGTSFHQSCGYELKRVSWDEGTSTLSGEVDRPAGETGLVFFFTSGREIVSAEVDGVVVPAPPAAGGAFSLPVTVRSSPASFRVEFGARR